MAPSNGLLLCANHHRLFDTGLITVSPTHVVTFYDPKGKDGKYSEADFELAIKCHGSAAMLPKKKALRPAPEALAHHHRMWAWVF